MVPPAILRAPETKKGIFIFFKGEYMKRILCYGDSNTWGNTGQATRYDDKVQWPVILQNKLGEEFKVVQEGLRARIAGGFETERPYLNGQGHFEAIFRSAAPVSFAVIALGTNDFKSRYSRSAKDIYADLMWYADKIKELQEDNYGHDVKVIFLTPANFLPSKDYFDADPSIREGLLELFMECEHPFIMLSDLEITEDGVHYTQSDHQQVAQVVYSELKELGL